MKDDSLSYLPMTDRSGVATIALPMPRVSESIQISIVSPSDIVVARQKGRIMTQDINCSVTSATLVATAISELARNIILYAEHGEITLNKIENANKVGIEIIATDKGPGIQNIARAMMTGFSTSGGLGLGLPGLKQMADSFQITSKPEQGVRVEMLMWLAEKYG